MYLCKNGREINVTEYGELFIVQKALKLMHLKIVNFYRQTDQKKMLPKNEQLFTEKRQKLILQTMVNYPKQKVGKMRAE